MYLNKNWFLRHLVPVIAIFGAILCWSSPSDAYVQQIVIDQTATVDYTPITLGTSTQAPSTSYTIYQGRVFGTLNPTNPLNTVITDFNLASPVSGGYSYITNFQIVTPTNPAARNGLLIHAVPNRGGNAINTSALIQGATYVQSGWQGDLLAQCSPGTPTPYPCNNLNSGPYGTLNTTTGAFTSPTVSNISGTASLASYVVQVPVATLDGNAPNGTNTITGQVYGHVCIGTNGCGLAVGASTSTAQLQIQAPAFVPYQPASTDTNQAQLWTVSSQTSAGVDSAKTQIPSAQWSWAYCPIGPPGTPNPNWICLNGATFNPNLLYEVVYTAANPLVLGTGFAAFRDLASFLRYGTTAPGGGSNPIASSITRAYTVGASQSAAFIHGFIFYGFNEDEDGRIVFDGAWPQIDGRMMVMNIRWGQPNNLMYLYMGGDEAPVWWADYPNLARNLPADGMLHRCTATGTCPQVLETFASAELYSEKMSVSLCGFTCVADIPLPSNVYRYYSPGATHGGGTVSFNWTSPGTITAPTGQSLPNDPIPETYTNNALQYAFIQLLMNGTAMPPSVYPTLASGQLVPNTQAAEGFPNIAALPFGGNQAWPPFVYNFGSQENYDQESGIPTVEPPAIQQVLSVYATTVNADGNENAAGLPTVLGQAPLGTYVGWNLATTGWYGPNESNGPGSVGQVFAGAGNSGGFWPFWDTQSNRLAAGDPRLSLEERYGTSAGYQCVVQQAVTNAVQQRFLLSSDATTLLTMASSSNVLAAPFVPTTADTRLGEQLCGVISGTTTTVTSSLNPSVFGQSITFTATVSPAPPGSGTPTGSVNFLDGGSQIGTGTLGSGQTTFSTSALAVGSHTITASYGGDTNFNGSSGSLTGNPQVVNSVVTATQAIASTTLTENQPATSFTPVTGSGGTPPLSYGVSPNLPTGLSMASGSGAITGTPTVASAATNYTVTVTDANSATAMATFSLTVSPVPPTVTAVSPNGGPPAGGTSVTITGTNFTGASAVSFGGSAARRFAVNGPTSITALSPGGAAGTVDVTVTTGNVTSATSAADHFTYASPRMTQQGPKLVGSSAKGKAEQGSSVALSANGNTAIVGGPDDNAGAGAAWLFDRGPVLPGAAGPDNAPASSVTPAVWLQAGAKLVGTGSSGVAQQGYAVALSGDGNTAIVGGYKDNLGIGAVWIFTRNGAFPRVGPVAEADSVPAVLLPPGQWSQQGAKLVAGNEAGAGMFGVSVALSTDGNTAIIGGSADSTGTGAAWIFTRSNGVWSEQAKLIGSGAVGNAFQGISVALSSDGNTALIGGYGDDTDNGAAWVFVRSGATWTQQGAKLLGSGNVGAAEQGYAVALSADGNTALVGGFADNADTGAGWIFSRSGGVWTQLGSKLIGTGAVGTARQGFSVALSGDASTAAMAGYEDNAFNGAVWVFTQSAGAWTQFGSKLFGSGAAGAAEQGSALALSANGKTLLEGGAFDNAGAGAAWIFVAPGAGAFTATPSAGQGPLAVTFSASGLTPPMTYTVNFGDGTTGALSQSACIGKTAAGGAQCAGSASHIYSSVGTDTATLLNASGVPLGSATITVNASTPSAGVTANHP
jgi:hypothetical protein